MLNIIKKVSANNRVHSFFVTLVTEIIWGPAGAAIGVWMGSYTENVIAAGGLGLVGYALFRTLSSMIVLELKNMYPKKK